MKKITLALVAGAMLTTVQSYTAKAQDKSKKGTKGKETQVAPEAEMNKPANKPAAIINTDNSGYLPVAAGTDYKIITDVPSSPNPAYGDYLELHLQAFAADSLIFDTRSAMNGAPAPIQLVQSPFKGDLLEALKFMTPGDSAIVRLNIDSLMAAGAPPAPWMKSGVDQKLVYKVRLVSVKPQAVKQKEERDMAAKQGLVDENLIKEHLAKNKIKATRTASGLYYTITKEGAGVKAEPKQKVSVNYTGMLLNGDKFDSNMLPEFNHMEPFQFMLGTGSVIKGWDEGIALLKKGGKATLYIPSPMAYGAQSPSPKIPANSVLVFDVELLDIIKDEEAPKN